MLTSPKTIQMTMMSSDASCDRVVPESESCFCRARFMSVGTVGRIGVRLGEDRHEHFDRDFHLRIRFGGGEFNGNTDGHGDVRQRGTPGIVPVRSVKISELERLDAA